MKGNALTKANGWDEGGVRAGSALDRRERSKRPPTWREVGSIVGKMGALAVCTAVAISGALLLLACGVAAAVLVFRSLSGV